MATYRQNEAEHATFYLNKRTTPWQCLSSWPSKCNQADVHASQCPGSMQILGGKLKCSNALPTGLCILEPDA